MLKNCWKFKTIKEMLFQLDFKNFIRLKNSCYQVKRDIFDDFLFRFGLQIFSGSGKEEITLIWPKKNISFKIRNLRKESWSLNLFELPIKISKALKIKKAEYRK